MPGVMLGAGVPAGLPPGYAGAMTTTNTSQKISSTNTAFLDALRPALSLAAEPARADGMATYMKSSMPFMGVRSPEVRKIVRALAKQHPFAGVDELHATAMELWLNAGHREERYAAIMLTDSPLGRGELGLLPFYAVAIETGQWWDYVDSIAPRLCELLLKEDNRDSGTMKPQLRQWSVHPNFWFRRASILAQLPAGEATDTVLLADVIRPNLADGEFFIRKAIGWALRQHARTDPDWVRSYVADHEGLLSPLSRREALKHL